MIKMRRPQARTANHLLLLSIFVSLALLGIACGSESVHAKQLSIASDSNRIQLTFVRRFGITFEKEGFYSTLDSVESAYEVTAEALRGSDSNFSEIENRTIVYKRETDAIRHLESTDDRTYPSDAFWGVLAYGRIIPSDYWGDDRKAWKAAEHHVIAVRKGRVFSTFRFQSLYGSHPIGSDMEIDQRAEAFDLVRGIVATW